MKKQTVLVALALVLGFGGATFSLIPKAHAGDSGCPSANCNGGNLKCCTNGSGGTWFLH